MVVPILVMILDSPALRTEAVKLQFVAEAFEAGAFFDVALEGLDGAGDVEALDATAAGADEVVVVMAFFDDGVVGAAVVQAELAEDAVLFELHEQAIDGGAIGTGLQARGFGHVREVHGLVRLDEDVEHVFQRLRAAEAHGFGLFEGGGEQLTRGFLVVVLAGGAVMMVEHAW